MKADGGGADGAGGDGARAGGARSAAARAASARAASARERLEQLVARHGLDARAHARLDAVLGYLDTAERAPSGVREAERAVDVHVADALVALDLEVVRGAASIVDVGSGVGFPGVALAAALVEARVTLLESQERRCAFLRELVAHAGLANAEVACARVEEWASGLGAHDLVVVRALAAQAVVLEYAAPLLRIGGSLVDWRGRRSEGEEEQGLRAGEELGLARVEVHHVEPYDGARDHHLHVFAKRSATPARFPRRAGMARKRPLGAS